MSVPIWFAENVQFTPSACIRGKTPPLDGNCSHAAVVAERLRNLGLERICLQNPDEYPTETLGFCPIFKRTDVASVFHHTSATEFAASFGILVILNAD